MRRDVPFADRLHGHASDRLVRVFDVITLAGNSIVLFVLLAATGTVGLSRLYLGAHHLSDVLAGISFGFAWAMLCLIAYTLWGERNLVDALRRRSGRGRQSAP